jgi:hypothetical protein
MLSQFFIDWLWIILGMFHTIGEDASLIVFQYRAVLLVCRIQCFTELDAELLSYF